MFLLDDCGARRGRRPLRAIDNPTPTPRRKQLYSVSYPLYPGGIVSLLFPQKSFCDDICFVITDINYSISFMTII